MATPLRASSEDLAVQATNDDATSCKRYAVDRGYWKDDYIQLFCRSSDRKSPEMSRGYYARVHSIHSLVRQFLNLTSCECQIVNFGAGSDSLFWLLHADSLSPRLFVEVDFAEITAKKCQCIRTKQILLDSLSEPSFSGSVELHSKHYHLLSGDLRNMDSLSEKLLSAGLDRSLPTLFLAECVLVYMESRHSQSVIKWAGNNFKTGLFINYDPILPHDSFGKVMQQNLKRRGCSLLGIDACPDLNSQSTRYKENGWENAWALDMTEVYSLLPKNEIQRIERIDFLDEKEPLVQLLQHYTLSCGFSDPQGIGLNGIQLGK